IPVSSTTLMLVVMLCLAVGIDYALFIISRHRDQLAAGMEPEESAARAVATGGSAVVFAGLTVIIALVGLSIAGLPFLSVMGIFTAVGVAFEVLLALTLLPAFIGFAGERLRPRTRAAAKPAREPGRAARWWVGVITKWPLVTVLVVVVGMGALAYPALGIEMALPNSGRAAPGEPDRIAFDLTTQEFGIGFNGPLVITGSIVESDDPVAILDGIRADVEAMEGVQMVAAATPNANADTAMVQVIPTTGPDDPATAELVDRLRSQHDHWLDEYGIDTSITGLTAAQIDVNTRLRDALLPFGVFVVGLSLILLMMAFRSVWVPVKAALGYLLSVCAAFGVVTLVFNHGVGGWLINLAEPGPVISFLPIILLGILVGLAMA
ncbi:MAG: MMPL family transporter, partial [Propionicimonas sp.]|nr:MMPL family transporter [Propionicimonas sp.]